MWVDQQNNQLEEEENATMEQERRLMSCETKQEFLRLCTLVILQHLLLHNFTLLATSFAFLFVIHQLVPIIHYQFNSTGLC
ncbi:unnamed protein product [Lactuca virosa]|uniref:Uncharacterized protein n=1 Tax=Lactuca virosa TaxID=75947 RepID=A0AAU9MHQ6_9ASTR|nr:unnamed protein product [Lactuca virosa]